MSITLEGRNGEKREIHTLDPSGGLLRHIFDVFGFFNPKEMNMGGNNETKLGSLRMHENKAEVHVHNDAAKVKFCMSVAQFKSAFATLKQQLVDRQRQHDQGNRPAGADMIEDLKGVQLIADLSTGQVAWRLKPKDPVVHGLDDMEAFVAKL